MIARMLAASPRINAVTSMRCYTAFVKTSAIHRNDCSSRILDLSLVSARLLPSFGAKSSIISEKLVANNERTLQV
jgi:hypothetical protein